MRAWDVFITGVSHAHVGEGGFANLEGINAEAESTLGTFLVLLSLKLKREWMFYR